MSHSVDSILSQIRSYQTRIGPAPGVAVDLPRSDAIPVGGAGRAAETSPGFGATLRSALEGVNAAQQRSGELVKAFELGEPGADLARVMVAAQQSQVAFRATVEVRNRLVQAYQDVMNMPL
ncbi:flagellar hook-basal body complex protein FliE [Luteimonas granuli]|uniref:Flagellar hook-basal body complex protein FliE n=1 Tax=Luteimonas granuli TaxID=1176533 RepID=A0A518N0X0_9GAMM|nr:flagellar hook-basal body complex protein FliE [Luteimonas granuli]QDW65553.1 flagellar hook-basal body complex protein FliE [Luteimonas granuli]